MYLQLRRQCRFVGGEKDCACFQDAPQLLVKVYEKRASQVDRAGSKRKIEAITFSGKKASLVLRRTADRWAEHVVFVPVHTFPVRIMKFLGKVYKNRKLFEYCWHIYLFLSCDKWFDQVYVMHVETSWFQTRPQKESI